LLQVRSDIYFLNCGRCGNVAAILELDENLNKFYKIFEAAPQVIGIEKSLTLLGNQRACEQKSCPRLFPVI